MPVWIDFTRNQTRGRRLLKVKTHDSGVAQVILNRPERRNAIGSEMIERLTETFAKLNRDPAINAIMLTGAAPAFCAGSDLKELAGCSVQEMCDHEANAASFVRQIAVLGKPVIAGVRGYALGGGFILAISCDIIVTEPVTRWHLPEVPLGWLPPWGLQALVARVGPAIARRITWGSEPLSGLEAHRLGVVDFVGADAECEALMIAERLAALPSAAVASTKAFFQDHIAAGAEISDERANRMFAADCEHTAAKNSLAKFET